MEKLLELEKKLREYKEELEKAIREPTASSPSIYENPKNVEGAAKDKKYQGGDPKHFYGRDDVNQRKTKAGLTREVPEGKGSITSGSSSLRHGTKISDQNRETTNDTTGKKVPWGKSEAEEISLSKNGQWNLEKAIEVAGLKKSIDERLDNLLEKAVKPDALRRLARDLAPHSNSVSVHHLDDNLERSNTPHPEGLVGFDISHDEANKDAVDRILAAHGHFNHPGSFAEDMDGTSQYGALKLHPEHAKHLMPGEGYSGTRPDGANITPVQDPAVGSMNLYEGSETGEGDAIPAKWQGSDPRHREQDEGPHGMDKDYPTTRAGQKIAIPSAGQFKTSYKPSGRAATSGVSDRGYERTETGKPVKKSIDERLEELEKGLGKDLETNESKERVKHALGSIRPSATVTDLQGKVTEVSPEKQVSDKQSATAQRKANAKAHAESEAAARRAGYKKQGLMKNNEQWELE